MLTLFRLAKKPRPVDFAESFVARRRLDLVEAPLASDARWPKPDFALPPEPPRGLLRGFSADSVTARAPEASDAYGASSSSTSRISNDSVTGPGSTASSSKKALNASSSSRPSHSHRSHLSRRGFRAFSVVSFFCTRL